MEMLYKYEETFSLRDEIGTWPNTEVEIDITDKSPFFIRPYHGNEEHKTLINKEMKRLMLSRNIKGRFFTLFQPSTVD